MNRLGIAPDGWGFNTFDDLDICIVDGDRGNNYPKSSDYLTSGHCLFLGATNVINDRIDLTELIFISEEKHKQMRKGVVEYGDLLLIMRGNGTGRIALYDGSVSYQVARINSGLAIIRPSSQVSREYLTYVMRSKMVLNQFDSCMFGSAQPQLTIKILKSLKLPIPPLSEQKKIARILSTWNRAIAVTEKLLNKSQQQKKSLMQQLLTGKKRILGFSGEWQELHLSDVCNINPKKFACPQDSKVSFIPMDAVSENAKLIRADVREYAEVNKGFTSFIDGDVLVAKITPCFENSKGAYIGGLINGVGFGSTEFHVLRAKQKNHSEFIYYLTNSYAFRAKGLANMQGSAGQKRVPTDYLRVYKTAVPPRIEEQKKISSVLSVADKEIETLQQKLNCLKQEKKALMQQLLTGKRRVVL